MTKLFRDLDGGPLCPQGSVVCIGGFDGLHVGHQALLRRVHARAAALGVPAAAVSFEPLPREFFAADGAAPARLTPVRSRIQGFRALGMDVLGLLRFNRNLASCSAEDFVRRLLVARLRVREVWVGEGFRFGHRRLGDVALLRALGAEHGFATCHIAPVEFDGERVSATRIRSLLAEGRLDAVEPMLGQPYRLAGRVLSGARLGRTLGYPTANIGLRGKRPALSGIFAVNVVGVADRLWPGVASLGTRPTVDDGAPVLEVHLFDFDGDLYGRCIEVEFVAKLRDELRFPDLPSLVEQMRLDEAQARALLATVPEPATGRRTA